MFHPRNAYAAPVLECDAAYDGGARPDMTVQVGALGGTGLAAPIGRNPGVDMRILTLPFLIIAIAAPGR